MRRLQHVTPCCCGRRSDKLGGGLNLLVLAWHGPRHAFAIKKLKLNTKSPPGGWGIKSVRGQAQLPRLLSRAQKISVPKGLIFQSEIKRFQTQPRPLCARRRGGGFHHGRVGRRKPRWRYSEIFFRRPNFRTAPFGFKHERQKFTALKSETNQQLAKCLELQHRACCCSQADLFSDAKRCRPRWKKRREIQVGGYGR